LEHGEATILIDEREKKPYDFNAITDGETEFEEREARLDVGDYTLDGIETVAAVERKTLDDLARSLGKARDRFEDEMVRAQSCSEFVVVIEARKSSVFAYRDQNSCPNYYSNIYPDSIASTVESWSQKYNTLRFEWAGSRQQGAKETLYWLANWYVTHLGYS